MKLKLTSISMHPHTFYSSLYDRNKRDEVFVIMSFNPLFNPRWEEVIKPTIENDLNLLANRVDYKLSGESILHDILDGIANSKLVIADITSTEMSGSDGIMWPQRNGNVMWELGIAHSMRLPDEVIMIRSDNSPSIFDLTQFRAFQYDPTDKINSCRLLKHIAEDRLSSISQTKSRKVTEAIESLDADSIALIRANSDNDQFIIHRPDSMREVMKSMADGSKAAIRHLLSYGIIKADNSNTTSQIVYLWTDFGRAVLLALK